MPLILGDFEFADFEIPERISGLGGKQSLAVHKMIGGTRVIDAMGADDGDPEWAGRFAGSDAAERCQQLDQMRRDGLELPLTFGSFFYTVVISEFTFDYEREYQIRYHMKVAVVSSDLGDVDLSLDDLVTADLSAFSDLIGDFTDAAG